MDIVVFISLLLFLCYNFIIVLGLGSILLVNYFFVNKLKYWSMEIEVRYGFYFL